MGTEGISRKSYLTKNVGDYAPRIELADVVYEKVNDLRYGTNPQQTAAYYKPIHQPSPIADMNILKTGKSGLSQTNLEDISYALNIGKFFARPCCICMKHVNPCGVAVAGPSDTLCEVYIKARDCDPRAAFGCVVGFNTEVDQDTAVAIMGTFVECVVAPAVTAEALAVFNEHRRYKRNQHIRILQCGDLTKLPKFSDDNADHCRTCKVLADGSLVIADPLLTSLRRVSDLRTATADSKATGPVSSAVAATREQLDDLLTAWYINMNVRSNGVVIVKNGVSLAVGTGEQDRVGAVEQAVWKVKNKYQGTETIAGSVMASDGFFPFYDAVETAAAAGVSAFIAPAGSLRDGEVIQRANALGVALYHAPERIFSHH